MYFVWLVVALLVLGNVGNILGRVGKQLSYYEVIFILLAPYLVGILIGRGM